MSKTNPPNKNHLIGILHLLGPATLGPPTGTRTFRSAPRVTVRLPPATAPLRGAGRAGREAENTLEPVLLKIRATCHLISRFPHLFSVPPVRTVAEDGDGGGACRRKRGRRRRRRRSSDGGAFPGPAAAWCSSFPGLRGGCHGQAGGAGARRLWRL